MSSNNKKYTWLLLVAYVMMAMHSFTPHVHHDHDEEHAVHKHSHEHEHDHDHDHEKDDDQTTDLQHGFAHFLHNGGDYELYSREHAAPAIKEQAFIDILIRLSNFNTPPLPAN